jgi:hypothetical protein
MHCRPRVKSHPLQSPQIGLRRLFPALHATRQVAMISRGSVGRWRLRHDSAARCVASTHPIYGRASCIPFREGRSSALLRTASIKRNRLWAVGSASCNAQRPLVLCGTWDTEATGSIWISGAGSPPVSVHCLRCYHTRR